MISFSLITKISMVSSSVNCFVCYWQLLTDQAVPQIHKSAMVRTYLILPFDRTSITWAVDRDAITKLSQVMWRTEYNPLRWWHPTTDYQTMFIWYSCIINHFGINLLAMRTPTFLFNELTHLVTLMVKLSYKRGDRKVRVNWTQLIYFYFNSHETALSNISIKFHIAYVVK